MQVLIIFIVIAAFILIIVAGAAGARKRREAFRVLAARIGLQYEPSKSRDMAKRYKFLEKLRRGYNRYAYNILTGSYKKHELTIFDYHYQTGSGKNTQHYHFSFFILHLPVLFPELVVGPEGIFSKIAQNIGYDDIDFESHEFSRKFCVRSKDKKFAYDVCNARMIEYLLANDDLTIEIENNAMAISFNKRLKPEQIEPNLNRLIEIRSLLPEYLFVAR